VLEPEKMGDSEKDGLARIVKEQWLDFRVALSDNKRKYPTQEFHAFVTAAKRYIDLTRRDRLVHKTVVEAINGLTEFLQIERKRIPGGILHEADRLECLFFGGYDPHFEGDEPPGL
jgi:hypothetical protein